MPAPYKAFPIKEFVTGIDNYLQPWQRPIDAFEPLVNAYINRGAINKRAGFTQFGSTVPDSNPIMGIMRYIDQATSITYLMVATTVHLYKYITGVYTAVGTPPTFTGNITNFFNYCNWQDTVGAASLIYMTNNVDNITTYDGTNAAAFVPVIDGAGTTITKALDVQVYKQRLLYIRPTLSTGGVQNQSIYWSAVSNSSLNRNDIAGQGGFLAAPTGDIIISVEFVKDVLLVWFSNSTWIFRFTGNQSDPFRWDKINDSKSTSCPYGSISYDQSGTSIGSTGLIQSDANSVERYDIKIIDYYEDNFSIQFYAQAFAQRYDNLNQTWMLYVSNDRDPSKFPLVGGIAPGSDSALIYNFIEKSWATYTFPVPMTCMGLFYSQSGSTWASLTQSWENTDQAWNTYSSQKGAYILLMGDTSGHIYQMDNEAAVTDNGTAIVPDIVSTRWNPLIDLGVQSQFGYIDIYYYISSLDEDNPIQVTLNFYMNNSETPSLSKILTLDGPVNSEYTFKRVYTNLIGTFMRMEIDPSVNSYMQFIGFILWVRPAGRLTR